ncbi:ATP-binding cassette domain-containing protein [Pigmentiphaga aceris]|uniref:Probable ATP-binding protein YheS n=1 Tax=Pigmentiphaga aceris TaxID=1940612 RepID=A0A5C0AZ41_9BURK|nr:ATP-binding cassette domain-containing protein [Pigmentiphaga aceris]QEI06864.1 ATP-binding cassette domain-containing protein [Pigmentiphaga aceris]
MIRASGLTLRRGTKVLLDGADFVVHPGERVGIVGPNGAGKSTLFALFTGRLDADAGDLDIPATWKVAAIAQEIDHTDRAAVEFVMDGDGHLRSLQAARASINAERDGTRLAELEAELFDAGVFTAQSRAEQLLVGLGFSEAEFTQAVTSFSGGWRMRLNLARALMAPSDLLLLDEPTNHLDLDAMLWLERWLASYPGTVMVISHDTEFLDAVARTILHFDHAKLIRYKGGYEDFVTQRAERMRLTQIAFDRQTKEAARLQGFIDRFKAQATKAKQAQSRVKALGRMQMLAPLRDAAAISIRIPSPSYMPDPLLTLDKVSAGYGEKPILRGVELQVRSGARIGILGANGAGKSTLVKTLADELAPLAGARKAARGLEVGYFAQHQLDILDLDASPLQHLARIAPDTREQDMRNYLGGFGFSGEFVTSLVRPMSGGEKARLALALIVWKKPNLLLLDEPSNHLDVDTREALTEALAEFEGTMLLVSHDRHLLRTTVDSFWIVADGGVQNFDGDLEDYRDWLSNRRTPAAGTATSGGSSDDSQGTDRKATKREEAENRQRLSALRKPLEAKLQKLETTMAKNEARRKELDALIADPELYEDARKDECRRVMAEHGELLKQAGQVEEEWLEMQESLEQIAKS